MAAADGITSVRAKPKHFCQRRIFPPLSKRAILFKKGVEGIKSLFCCPICGGTLAREEKRCACPAGHSFDLAREGYVNLLPANRQHSKAPGDDRDMTAARTRFLDGGWYSPLRTALVELAEKALPPGGALLDAGCGEGWYTSALAEMAGKKGGRTAGADLSKPAVKKAARRCPEAEIAVASVYHLPVAEGLVDVLTDCFSPLAAEEFARVIRPGGVFLYVVPGPRHLWELKELLYESPYENEEKEEEYPGFALEGITAVESRFTLTEREDILALFGMTPYAWKTPKEAVERLERTQALTVTAQFRIHSLRRQ